MNEEAAAEQYLLDYLTADTTLMGMLNSGVWLRSVAQTARFPVVKIDREDAEDLLAFGTMRVWANITFLVRGVVHWTGSGLPDWTDVRAIGDRLDTLLHAHTETTETVRITSWREESYTDETVEDTDLFLQVGGLYRVTVQAV